MGTPSANQYFEAGHGGPGTPQDPNLFTAAEIVAGSFDSAAVSTATSKAVSTITAAAPDSTNLSIADSKGVSSGTRASVADSKAISGSVNTSVADSKTVSGSTNTSIADSKAVSVAVATPTVTAVVYSAAISVADSKGVSAAAAVVTATVTPAGTRTVTALTTYLTDNAIFNVLDYAPVGYVINTGLNPTQAKAAIVAADLAASASKGGKVVFPPGTYAWSGDLTPLPGAHWEGSRVRQYAVKLKAQDSTSRWLITDDGRFQNFQVEGSVTTPGSYVGTGIQVGNTTFAGHVSLEDIYVDNFQVGLRLAAALWTTFNRCQFELCQIGIDFNAGGPTLYSTTVTFTDCVARQNERNGIAASYVPITNQRITWTGGASSVETNCTSDTVTYPQVAFGSVGYFEFDTYMEGGLYGGFYPVAINGDGMQQGKISGYIHNCSRGIEALAGTMTDIEIKRLRFAGTTTKCLNIAGVRVHVYPSCVFDATNTLGGSNCSLITNAIPDYSDGTFVPSFTNLTVVNGTGSATYSGTWTKHGRPGSKSMVFVQINILVTGTCTTAATANSTTITNLPFNVTKQGVLDAVDGNIVGLGQGTFYSLLTAYTPTWSARNTGILLSGWYETAD